MELIIISIAFVLGIIWGLYFNISMAFFLPCLVVIVLFIKKEYRKYLLIFIFFLLFSNIYISALEHDFNSKFENIEGEVTVVGTVISEPKIKDKNTQCIIQVEKINDNYKYKDIKVLVNINLNYSKIRFGNKIKMYGELKDASVARNEGGFDYKQYLKTKRIYKIISIKKNDIKIIEEDNSNFFDKGLYLVKKSITENIKKILPEKEANFLIAVTLGDKQELDEDIQNDFRNSSLSHILAVSGMHVSYIITGLTLILNKTKIGSNKTKTFLILFLIFFIMLTGGTPSVQRACIMSIYMIIGSLLHRRVNTLNSIAFSSLVILIINPYNLLDIGFQLSFGGTLGIVLLYPKLKRKIKFKSKIIDIILVTISANIIIFPTVLYHYNTISTTFLLSNLLVSFIIGIVLIFGITTIITSYIIMPLSKVLVIIEKILIDFLLQIANMIGSIPFSQIYFITPKIYMILIYYLFVYLWR